MKYVAWGLVILLIIGIIFLAIKAQGKGNKSSGGGNAAKLIQLRLERDILYGEIKALQDKTDNAYIPDVNDLIDLQVKKNRLADIDNEISKLQK